MLFGQPLRQLDMKALRSSPFKPLTPASLLQAVILSCCVAPAAGVAADLLAGVAGVAGAAAPFLPDRQLDMKALRASPDRFLALASALHWVMRSCCVSARAAGALMAAKSSIAVAKARRRSEEH